VTAGRPEPLEKLRRLLEGSYRIERELARGSMARVYLADDIRRGGRVAVKLLPPDLASESNAERFLREIRITAGLRHPNILPLIDSGVADGLYWYVMPLVEGESLRERMATRGLLPIPDAVDFGIQIGRALGYAHAAGVVHRDLKPENVMLAGTVALVMDFGLARALGSDTKLTGTGMPLGTPAYMSPEQITGAAEADPRADLYCLGCVLHEMLTGQPPFVGPSVVHLLRAHMTEPPPPPSRRRASVPPGVDRVVVKALAKDPNARHQSADELVAELAACVAGSGDRRAGASTPSPPRPSTPPAGQPGGLLSRLFGRRGS
jgi:serine/threonine-protein kinase